jgi:hypothetical protein
MIGRLLLALSLSALLSAVPGGVAFAQEVPGDSATPSTWTIGSRYLSLGHWAYDYLDLLIARGSFQGLALLVQPYRRIDIAAAIARAERQGSLRNEEQQWVERLRIEFAPELRMLEGKSQRFRFGAEFGAGFSAMSHTHRDVLRPEGDERAFAVLDLVLAGEAPAVAGAFDLRWNNHYLHDPQFPDGLAIEFRECDPLIARCAYRTEEAYVELQLPYARVFFGKMDRNWGVPTLDGFLLSDYSYSYDHLSYRFGSARVSLSGVWAMPTDFLGDTVRYFSTHRFDWQIRDNLSVALAETAIWGGPDAKLELAWVNPVGIWAISGKEVGQESREGELRRNMLGLVEVWWRPFSGLAVNGSFVVDNTSVGSENAEGLVQWAGAAGVQLLSLVPNLSLRADVSVASSLAYRSSGGFVEYYALQNIGLAQDRVDVVLVATQADWFARPGLVLKPKLDFMWKGEADLTDPWPGDAFTGYPLLLSGVVEKTIRPALAGRWNLGWGTTRQWTVDGIWDLGVNLVQNRGHVESDWSAEFVGKIGGEIRFSLLR